MRNETGFESQRKGKGSKQHIPTAGAHGGANILCACLSSSIWLTDESQMHVWEPSASSHPHERGRFSIKLVIADGLGMIHAQKECGLGFGLISYRLERETRQGGAAGISV